MAGHSVAHPEIEVVEPAGVDAHHHLARSGDRIEELLRLDHLRSTVPLDHVTAHGRSLPPR